MVMSAEAGAWLSWSERLVYTQDVGGSNPSAPIRNVRSAFGRPDVPIWRTLRDDAARE